jgi:hypothetical protein
MQSQQGVLTSLSLAIAFTWMMILIAWFVIRPPVETYRMCTGSMQIPFRLIQIAFRLWLILEIALMAHRMQRLSEIVPPVFSMLFVIALFEPISFFRDISQFLGRQTVLVVLQPAVGILLGTTLQAFFILMPPLKETWQYAAEDMLVMIRLEKELELFRYIARRELMVEQADAM